jgi:hypothetical protein
MILNSNYSGVGMSCFCPTPGSDLWADRGEWQSEIKARNCALRANIAQFPHLSVRAVRPEVGPYLGLSRLYVEHQSTAI